MTALTSADEIALARKLAETLHLNVEERGRIPGGVRLSAVVAAVREVLAAGVCFPRPLVPGAEYEGVVIEQRADGAVWTHERHEVGVGRLSQVHSVRAQSLDAAVTHYLRVAAGGAGNIDGVPIQWQA